MSLFGRPRMVSTEEFRRLQRESDRCCERMRLRNEGCLAWLRDPDRPPLLDIPIICGKVWKWSRDGGSHFSHSIYKLQQASITKSRLATKSFKF